MIRIGVLDANDQLIETVLDGTTFFIKLSWNEACKQYTISLKNAEGESLINGITVVENTPLFYRIRQQFMPLGDLYVVKNFDNPIEKNDFINDAAQMFYITEQELKDVDILTLYGRI